LNPLRPRSRPHRSPPLAPPAQTERRGERIQKLLAAAGYGSRRQIEAWIAAGRITVTGRVARLGDRAAPDDPIALDGNPLQLRRSGAEARVILYHKPEGELVTRSDPEGRRAVFERLPPLRDGRWIAVGRLDLNSSGLLLFTNSGDLANRLMHPRHEIEREYAVRARGELSEERRSRLLAGVTLDDGVARFEHLEESGKPEGANRWVRVTLREGRNREVRRLFEAIGMTVSRLLRIRFGPVRLPRDLKPGRWIELAGAEVLQLTVASEVADIVPRGKSC